MSHAIARRIADLEQYCPPLTARPDLDAYWEDTLASFERKPLRSIRTPAQTPMPGMSAYKIEYEGFDDTPIHGWFLLPKAAEERGDKLPCVVLFHGYTGSKGYPEDYAAYALMGIAVFAIDVRGQMGETGNRLQQTFGMTRGWITQGILNRDTCYYRAITLDAIRAVEWASAQPEVDPSRICAQGGSQGGGLALMAAALSDKTAIAVAHIPNMCHMDFGILNSGSSLTEAAGFIERFPETLETVLETLSYYDAMNLAHRINIPLLVTVGLKDPITMPESIYAAYNRIQGDKEIIPYPFSGHVVTGEQNRRGLDFISERFGLS